MPRDRTRGTHRWSRPREETRSRPGVTQSREGYHPRSLPRSTRFLSGRGPDVTDGRRLRPTPRNVRGDRSAPDPPRESLRLRTPVHTRTPTRTTPGDDPYLTARVPQTPVPSTGTPERPLPDTAPSQGPSPCPFRFRPSDPGQQPPVSTKGLRPTFPPDTRNFPGFPRPPNESATGSSGGVRGTPVPTPQTLPSDLHPSPNPEDIPTPVLPPPNTSKDVPRSVLPPGTPRQTLSPREICTNLSTVVPLPRNPTLTTLLGGGRCSPALG